MPSVPQQRHLKIDLRPNLDWSGPIIGSGWVRIEVGILLSRSHTMGQLQPSTNRHIFVYALSSVNLCVLLVILSLLGVVFARWRQLRKTAKQGTGSVADSPESQSAVLTIEPPGQSPEGQDSRPIRSSIWPVLPTSST